MQGSTVRHVCGTWRVGTLLDWNGRTIEVANSDGGVLATINPFDNLVKTGISPWPTPEVIQKLYQSRQVR